MASLSWISSNPDYINQMIRNTQVTLSNNYNDLDNIPIIKITSTTNNPQKIWKLKEGLYMIDGVVQVDNNTSYEVSNLLISMTARLENGKYILSAFIPYLRGLFEYILKTNSTEYEQHQKIVLMIKNDTLTLDNETIYTPIEDYHPATKKYVDDKANEVVAELDRMGVNKENLESLNKENRIRDIKLQALLSETSDRNITIEEDVRYFDMPLSIDNGIVTINEMVGETLINVCDQEESVAITKSYTVENENHIALQGEYDGSCRPVLHGNTLVNHNADWNGNLQTGIEINTEGIENVEVDGTKGQEVSVVLEGNTVLNHALNKTSAVVSSIDDNLLSGDIHLSEYVTLNEDGSITFLGNGYKPNFMYLLNCNIVLGTTVTYKWDNLTIPVGCIEVKIRLRDVNNDLTIIIQSITITDETSVSFEGTFTASQDFNVGTKVGLQVIYTFNSAEEAVGIVTFDSPILLEGDHTTNPKYVNSNEGNYVDLTVTNDMSSVVEIEGRTMVNVCDQKDPIAITKSYTVENSGNHIALQGEYDGSCRPVIQGNTMVNLLPNLSFKIQTSQGQLWRYNYYTLNQPTKAYTVYTLIFDVIENTAGVTEFYFGGKGDSFELTKVLISGVGRYTVTVTSTGGTYDHSQVYVQFQDIYEIGVFEVRIMIFEGDLTQTPELIPTEYVEGLKSSFEDKYIPENLANKATYKIVGSEPNSWSKNISLTKSLEVGKTYTLICNVESYTLDAGFSIMGRVGTSSTNVQYGLMGIMKKAGVHCHSFIAEVPLNTLSIADEHNSTTGEATIIDFILIEGDYKNNPPTYEEVTNHAGKYKVEYKVTGKNKFDENYLQLDTWYGNDGIVRKDVGTTCACNIKVKPNTDYTVTCINLNRCEVWHYDKEGNFLAKTYGYSIIDNSFTLTTLDNTYILNIKVSYYENNSSLVSNIQIEEGTTATEYEPYKSYTKTFYLNSPFLEGDTIEDVNGVATHVKRYGKVVLDGNKNWMKESVLETTVRYVLYSTTHKFLQGTAHNNIKAFSNYNIGKYSYNNTDYIHFHFEKNKLNFFMDIKYEDMTTFKTMLNENPLIVVAKLTSPIYEPISTESILCDSYVNGHLDFNSAVPIEKVQFRYLTLENSYISPKEYIIQFNADDNGEVAFILGDTGWSSAINVIKGLNRVKYTVTKSTPNNLLGMSGIGFNASNIVVTEATDVDFDYFEGLKSSYECEATEDGKYKVDVKVIGKNLFDTGKIVKGVYLNHLNGKLLADSSYQNHLYIDYTEVKSNTTYVFNKHGFLVIVFYDNNKNYISGYAESSGYTFTTPTNCKFIRFRPYAINTSYENLQLEEGTVATSYEPYFESTKTFYLNSPLLEGDKIVTKNGKVYHYHKMGKVVLNGSDNATWWDSNSNVDTSKFIQANCQFSVISGYKTDNHKLRYCDNLIIGNNILTSKKQIDTDGWALYITLPITEIDHSVTPPSAIKKWLQANPTTVVYELASPYYELIDEYNNTILNIPKNVAHLTHTSTVPVNNTTFTNYKDELNVLEANTQYRLMFDCNTASIPFTVTLGGTSQEVTSKKGTHSLLITTPSTLVDKNLVIDGIGRCGIDNIRIFKGDVEYDYVKGLWSGYEERKLGNNMLDITTSYGQHFSSKSYNEQDNSFVLTFNVSDYPSFRVKFDVIPNPYKKYTVIFKAKSTVSNKQFKVGTCSNNGSEAWNVYNNSRGILTTNYQNFALPLTFRGDYSYLGFSFYTQPVDNPWSEKTVTIKDLMVIEGDWTDNPPTYEEVMANEGKYAVKVKLDNPNATIFGKGGRL